MKIDGYSADAFIVVGLGHIGLPVFYSLGKSYGASAVYGMDKDAALVSSIRSDHFSAKEPGLTLSPEQKSQVSDVLPVALHGQTLVQVAVDVSIRGTQYHTTNLEKAIQSCLALYKDVFVVIRSTISPQVVDTLATIQLGPRQGLYFCPEFMREGLALKDISQNPIYHGRIAVGSDFDLSRYFLGPEYDAKSLAVLKIANNAWRAEKVAFANLLAMISEKLGANPIEVSTLFLADRLNVSASYLRPGAPFGGYCLPKETQILAEIEQQTVGTRHFQSVMELNAAAISYWVDRLAAALPSRVVFETYSFKLDIEDFRNSPYLAIKDALELRGIAVAHVDEVPEPAPGDVFLDISCAMAFPQFRDRIVMDFSCTIGQRVAEVSENA